MFSAFETITSKGEIEAHSIFAEATILQLVVQYLKKINARNNSCSTKLLNSRLENKASRKYDGQNARNLLFRKQISTGCRPISDLRSETKRLNQGQSKENPWSGLVKDMITGQRSYRV